MTPEEYRSASKLLRVEVAEAAWSLVVSPAPIGLRQWRALSPAETEDLFVRLMNAVSRHASKDDIRWSDVDPRVLRGLPPKRIQRQRTKGWRMPEGAIYVGRPTRWGNHYTVGLPNPEEDGPSGPMSAETTVRLFAADVRGWNHDYLMRWLAPLRGHDLACWCRLSAPCHADVLLEMANQ